MQTAITFCKSDTGLIRHADAFICKDARESALNSAGESAGQKSSDQGALSC